MSKSVDYLKTGMTGSRNGRSRWEHTEILKKRGKKQRRKQNQNEIKTQLREEN